jgi:membrane fusion protein (multidrug efflux system)
MRASILGVVHVEKLLAGLGLIAVALTLSACDSSSNAEEEAPPATVRIETIEAPPCRSAAN